MRINVYAEELTDRTEVVTKTADTGRKFYGVRFYLESPVSLHHTPDDDDSSAITLWVPWTRQGGHDVDLLYRLVDKMLSCARDIDDAIHNDQIAVAPNEP